MDKSMLGPTETEVRPRQVHEDMQLRGESTLPKGPVPWLLPARNGREPWPSRDLWFGRKGQA